MTRLRVMSKVGRPRRRGPYEFQTTPTVVDVDPDAYWPANAAEAKQHGIPWTTRTVDDKDGALAPLGTTDNVRRKLIDMIRDDTDIVEDGQVIRSGGLIVQDVDANYSEPSELRSANDALASDNEALRSRLRRYEPQHDSTGAPERLARATQPDRPRNKTTPDDFGAGRTPAKPADK